MTVWYDLDRMKSVTRNDVNPRPVIELRALAALPDDRIDTRDMPEVTNWSKAERGRFFRPERERR
jgi:hypothetical protein